MFYFLHRLVKVALALCLILLVAWGWRQREAFAPVGVWYQVWQNGGIQNTQELELASGLGVHVLDGHSFQMKNGKGVLNVRLTGFETPTAPVVGDELLMERRRREFLRERVISNQVSVAMTYSNRNSVLGIVSVSGTNLNLLYITNGLSRLEPGYIKAAPRGAQYQLFAAARLFEKHHRGGGNRAAKE